MNHASKSRIILFCVGCTAVFGSIVLGFFGIFIDPIFITASSSLIGWALYSNYDREREKKHPQVRTSKHAPAVEKAITIEQIARQGALVPRCNTHQRQGDSFIGFADGIRVDYTPVYSPFDNALVSLICPQCLYIVWSEYGEAEVVVTEVPEDSRVVPKKDRSWRKKKETTEEIHSGAGVVVSFPDFLSKRTGDWVGSPEFPNSSSFSFPIEFPTIDNRISYHEMVPMDQRECYCCSNAVWGYPNNLRTSPSTHYTF